MAGSPTVVFVTGAGRGIGKAITQAYLLRPNHVVVGSVRDAASQKYDELRKTPAAAGSRLVLVSLENASLTDPQRAVEEVVKAGVSHCDIVIANAGISPTPTGPDTVDIKDVIDCLNVNAVSPVLLYQAIKPLLQKSAAPKWLTVSSAAGSIDRLEAHGASIVTAYGMSKAAVDFLTVAIHASNPTWIAFAIHPGLVQTDMGNMGAKMMGMEKAPNTLEESSSKTIDWLDNATREATSGKLWNVIDGTEIPW